MKPKRRRKSFKRKYKGLVAAMAGAAVLSSSLLPGLPAVRAHAAFIPNTTASVVTEQTETAKENTQVQERQVKKGQSSHSPLEAARKLAQENGFDAERDRFSLQWRSETDAVVIIRTEDGREFKMRLGKNDNNEWAVKKVTEIDADIDPAGDPVRTVKENAWIYGFDADAHTFSLLSVAGTKAIVQVRTSRQTFKVDLIKRGGSWEITTIRGIGNMKYPATYTPASMFRYQAPVPAPVVIPADSTVRHETDAYKDWTWHQTLYPRDMSFGVVLNVSQLVGSAIFIPDHVRDQIRNVDLDRQLVLFANLGSVPSRGYGIAIEKISQTGNNLIVTVAAKSPLADERLTESKLDDYILVNRSALDFGKSIQVLFVDRHGTPLSSFIILPR